RVWQNQSLRSGPRLKVTDRVLLPKKFDRAIRLISRTSSVQVAFSRASYWSLAAKNWLNRWQRCCQMAALIWVGQSIQVHPTRPRQSPDRQRMAGGFSSSIKEHVVPSKTFESSTLSQS